jgi:hypothetical protein
MYDARNLGWETEEFKVATTGSIYLTLVREKREWVVVRIADHKQYYHKWLTTYSMDPSSYSYEEIIELLRRPFGNTGDVLI